MLTFNSWNEGTLSKPVIDVYEIIKKRLLMYDSLPNWKSLSRQPCSWRTSTFGCVIKMAARLIRYRWSTGMA